MPQSFAQIEVECLDRKPPHHSPGRIPHAPAVIHVPNLESLLADPEQLFQEDVCKWHKREAGRRVVEVALSLAQAERTAFCKCIERPGLVQRILACIRRATVSRAFQVGHSFRQHQIATPEPLLCVDQRAINGRQYLLTASIPDSVTLVDFFTTTWPRLPLCVRQHWLRHGIHRLADQVRRMHECRYDHRDLKFANILVSTVEPGQSWLIDLDAVRRWPWLPAARAVQNISRLNVSSLSRPEIRHTDRVRFLKHYLGSRFPSEWKWWWHRIAIGTARKQKRSQASGRRLTAWAAALLALLPFCGLACATAKPAVIGLPTRHSVRTDQLLVQSNFKLPATHPLMQDLVKLRKSVSHTLDLPLGSKQVMVYLFSTELEYNQYWKANYPGFPPRRAYFVQTPDGELAVYTHWSDRIQEDLRHEFTHGLLHAGLKTVPLWLDEGLAEYFEVAGPEPGQVNPEYAQMLSTAVHNGWRPNMRRLETLEEVEQMQKTDYREAWAWMHFLLHSSPETKQILVAYLKELRRDAEPRPLSDLLREEMPQAEERLVGYVAALNTFGGGFQAGVRGPAHVRHIGAAASDQSARRQ